MRPRIAIGDDVQPTILFRLSRMTDGVAVEAKHSADPNWQTVLEIGLNGEGVLEARTRDIHMKALAQAMEIKPREGITTRFVSKALPE